MAQGSFDSSSGKLTFVASSTGKVIALSQMSGFDYTKLKSITLEKGLQFSDVAGVKKFPNLESIDLTGHNIANLDSLATHPKLESIYAADSDIEPEALQELMLTIPNIKNVTYQKSGEDTYCRLQGGKWSVYQMDGKEPIGGDKIRGDFDSLVNARKEQVKEVELDTAIILAQAIEETKQQMAAAKPKSSKERALELLETLKKSGVGEQDVFKELVATMRELGVKSSKVDKALERGEVYYVTRKDAQKMENALKEALKDGSLDKAKLQKVEEAMLQPGWTSNKQMEKFKAMQDL